MASSSCSNPISCAHLSDYKREFGSRNFENLRESIKPGPNGRARTSEDNTEVPRCSSCNGARRRLFMCLICSSISCSTHFVSHTQSEDRHNIAVDIQRLDLYCWGCGDQVYDSEFDRFVGSGINNGGSEVSEGRKSKRARLDSGIVEDSKKAKQLMSSYPLLRLRGLNNLGRSCFMNGVLQTFLHAPPVEHYFLAERHIRDGCPKNRRDDNMCLLCALRDVFSAMLSDDHTPYSATRFVHSFWRNFPDYASVGEKDPHEFLNTLFDGIHSQYEEDNPKTFGTDKGECQCIAHRAFSGLWRTDLTCTSCGYTSTIYCSDYFICASMTTSSSSLEPNEHDGLPTLLGCLEMYMRAERLIDSSCSDCKTVGSYRNQISITTLPVVLCLLVKRFGHTTARGSTKKDERFLQFPFELQLAEFLSSTVIRNRHGNRIHTQPDTSAAYEIFAVICHIGADLDTGHYVMYLCLNNKWYRCDDDSISEADGETVRASQVYMLFYVQTWLGKMRTSTRGSKSE